VADCDQIIEIKDGKRVSGGEGKRDITKHAEEVW